MPTETTAGVLIGPVTHYGWGGTGAFRAETVLTLEEGSRAAWVITELTGQPVPRTAFPDRPERLLAHGLVGYLATRPGGTSSAGDAGLAALATPRDNGVDTALGDQAVAPIAEALRGLRVVVTILGGSTLRAAEVEELRALGVSVDMFGGSE